MQSAAQPTCFLIADISGYTGYLAGVELDHAEDILSDLLGVIVAALRPNFRLSRIEGDAAFMFATVEKVDGSMLLDTIERCYFGFRRRRGRRAFRRTSYGVLNCPPSRTCWHVLVPHPRAGSGEAEGGRHDFTSFDRRLGTGRADGRPPCVRRAGVIADAQRTVVIR